MPAKTDNTPLRHLRSSDFRALAQLATHAALGVTRIVEGVHQSVWGTLGASGGKAPGQTGGVTGLVYKSINAVTQLLGSGVESLLATLQPLLESTSSDVGSRASPQREAVLAALNGVMGDRLAASNNPLAIAMSMRCQGQVLNWPLAAPIPEARGKVLLLIHGLCMNELQWRVKNAPPQHGKNVDHGQLLAAALGYTPVYLRYNTGLHTSQNGRLLAAQLQQLAEHWPVPIDEISVLAHSMGGLVIRSAVHYANESRFAWVDRLRKIIFLGTPHHGAPLERVGNRIDSLLGSTPYSAPFARLGHLRSAGITDLRYGHVLDEDWHGHDRFQARADSRHFLALPQGVACFTVAATTAARRSRLADQLIGDGLVPVPSALGQHHDARRTLAFPKSSQFIAYRTLHIGLLSSPEVSHKLLHWLHDHPEGHPPAAWSGQAKERQ
jgi:hypothetical protein